MAETPSDNHHEAGLREDIAALAALLQEKRANAESGGPPHEGRDAFHESFRERYGDALSPAPAAPAAVPVPLDEPLLEREAARVAAAADDESRLKTLVDLAFAKGVFAAAAVSRRASPWLMDALHDTLRDQYYDRLVAEKKIPQL